MNVKPGHWPPPPFPALSASFLLLLLAVFNHAYGGCKSPERLRSHSIFLVTLAFPSRHRFRRGGNGMDAHHGEGFERRLRRRLLRLPLLVLLRHRQFSPPFGWQIVISAKVILPPLPGEN